MKINEKQVRDVRAVMVQTTKNKPPVPGVSITVDYFPPPIVGTELVFTLKELKTMVKECENY